MPLSIDSYVAALKLKVERMEREEIRKGRPPNSLSQRERRARKAATQRRRRGAKLNKGGETHRCQACGRLIYTKTCMECDIEAKKLTSMLKMAYPRHL